MHVANACCISSSGRTLEIDTCARVQQSSDSSDSSGQFVFTFIRLNTNQAKNAIRKNFTARAVRICTAVN